MNAPLLRAMIAEDNETDGVSQALSSRMEECWDEPAPSENGCPPTPVELQGTWFSVLGRREAQFFVSGNRFTVRFADGDIYMGTFEVNPTTRPRAMDMRIEEGPLQHKGKIALCIYELDGPILRWCAALPGHTERLRAFPAVDDVQALCLLFQREQPV
jgi:uncharacterized protein (TIGR03067 family)